jgi:hypothetical protein
MAVIFKHQRTLKLSMKKIILLLLCYILFQACVTEFEVELPITQQLFIVDGSITDEPIDQYITLRITDPNFSKISALVVRNAIVEVQVNDKELIKLTDRNNEGIYYFPIGFRPTYNTNYKLKIKTEDGKQYESTNESMVQGPKIDKIYAEYKNDEIKIGNNQKIPAHVIYLDTKDPAGVKNNYFWTWTLWERQGWCKTCENSIYIFNAQKKAWECGGPLIDETYDYGCNSDCWEILYSRDLNVLNDIYADGKDIKARVITKIPLYTHQGALIEVSQRSVSKTAYNYLKLLINQGQNTGTLADTPPAALVGNIRNVNDPIEAVGGIFMVSSTQKQLFWLDRKDIPVGLGRPFYLLGGRVPNPEPPDGLRPPLAACVNSKFRTNVKPKGWL